jgi:hypothetical protein
MLIDKMGEILKNAKFNEKGIKILYNDFNGINKICCEFMYEFFYNQINYMTYLVEIFNTPLNHIDAFLEELNKDDKFKYDGDLLKVLVKKRKALKI